MVSLEIGNSLRGGSLFISIHEKPPGNITKFNQLPGRQGVPLILAVPRVQPQQKVPIKPQSWRRKQCLAVEEGLCFIWVI